MALDIRPALAPELEVCARIMSSSEPWITLRRGFDECLALLRDPARETYVAVDEGAVLGLIVVVMAGAFRGYVQVVAVDASRRSRGLGRALVAFAEGRIFRESPNVFLCVSSFNTRARKFYESLGYRLVGELEDYVVPGHSELLLRKTVGPLAGFRGRP